MILQTTLTIGAAAALLNLWFFQRIVRMRVQGRIVHGDGGNSLMLQRMRAHANFTEHAPLFLVLVAAVELSGEGGRWLAILGAVFMLARLAHAIGMDNARPNPARAVGMVVTIGAELVLAVIAVLIALARF